MKTLKIVGLMASLLMTVSPLEANVMPEMQECMRAHTTHGYNILKDALIGGTARKVVRNSEVPVMVIRLPQKE